MTRIRPQIGLLVGVLVAATVLGLGCNDRGQERDILTYTGQVDSGTPDATADAGPVLGPPCEGRDGSNCRPPRAFGVCLSGECQRIACVSGFIDCDSDPINGCETRVDGDDSCGACGVSCDDGELCQFGQLGFTCSAEVVCRLPRFDLDIDLENGCEWISEWGDGFVPGETDIAIGELVEGPSGLIGIGTSRDGPRLVSLPDWNPTEVGAPASGGVVGAEWDHDEGELLAVWPQSIVRWDQASVAQDTLRCESARELRDVELHPAHTMVAFDFGVTTWENREICSDCQIAGQLFEREDYLREFWPGTGISEFAADEVGACTPCSFDPTSGDATNPTACAPNACQPQGEPAGCEACDPRGCPTFEPVRVFSNRIDNRVYVVTRRGVVVLQYRGGWVGEWRLERAWDPDSAVGLAIVDAAIAPGESSDVLTFLDNAGRLSAIEFPRAPGEPPTPLADVGLGDPDSGDGWGARSAVYSVDDVRLVPRDTELLFVGKQGRSAAVRAVGNGDGPAIAGLEHQASTTSPAGFASLYRAPGVYFVRRFSR